MVYPSNVQLPENWEIRSEAHTRFNGDVVTNWYLFIDGEKSGSSYYASQDSAEKTALCRAELTAVDEVIEQTIGQERHYGMRVWSEPDPGRSTPTWKITDPANGHDGFAFAWYSHTPPPVDVYTREQYEAACAALELEPAADSELGSYGDKYGEYDPYTYTARQIITATLRRRRMAGLDREKAARDAEGKQQLEAAGLLQKKALSREEYEGACQTMQRIPLTDSDCVALVETDLAKLGGGVIPIFPSLPRDEASLELAYKRVTALENGEAKAGHTCDECGRVILGSGMSANFGLACDPDCYDAMSERPGRHAQSSQKQR